MYFFYQCSIKHTTFLVLIYILSISTSIGQVAAGKWFGTYRKDLKIALDLKVNGDLLTGNVYTSQGYHIVEEGQVDDETIHFTTRLKNAKLDILGYVAGDSLYLTISMWKQKLFGKLQRSKPGLGFPIPMIPEMTEDWEYMPPIVTPGLYNSVSAVPDDAIVLFNGTHLNEWEGKNGLPGWKIEDGELIIVKEAGNIYTKRHFGDLQMHIEWKVPIQIEGTGQSRSNSGIFMNGLYELQILDSYNNPTYSNGQAGSIYKQHPPLVNAMRPPGEWNVYDIIYQAPRFKEDKTLLQPAKITVFHNGLLIQNHVKIEGPTTYRGLPKYQFHDPKGPIMLQAHRDPSKAPSFRNIWIRAL
ncbi:MAG: DUF1080 domain-containing protein [Bacteroidota bacterium]